MSVNKEVLDVIDFIDRFIIDYRNTPLKKRITSISYRLAVSKYLSIEYKLNTKINSDTEVTINEIIENITEEIINQTEIIEENSFGTTDYSILEADPPNVTDRWPENQSNISSNINFTSACS